MASVVRVDVVEEVVADCPVPGEWRQEVCQLRSVLGRDAGDDVVEAAFGAGAVAIDGVVRSEERQAGVGG
jgi:hypothetical protein